ncbi:unnamed protein product [Amoebophrya sp. A25]|nr:unnamed protein product [Amoebophrya sp. A25]|eukprot:GSA25T00024244001.1
MVIPLPAVQVQPEPTQCGMVSRPWLYFLTCVVMLHAIELFWFRNIIGGFLMLILVSVGFYTLREGSLDMQCMVVWGMMCFINGVFSGIELIHRAVQPNALPLFAGKEYQKVLDAKLPRLTLWEWNMLNAFNIAGVMALVSISIVAFVVFRKSIDELTQREEQPLILPSRDFGGGRVGNSARGSGASPTRAPADPENANGRGSSSFVPFSGEGNRVGGADSD